MARVSVIGAGIGGLAAAIRLAAAGHEVDLFERGPTSGGKLRSVTFGNITVDCGPTVFTMRPVFESLFEAARTSLDQHLALNPLTTLARHAWQDGTTLDLLADRDDSAEAIAAFAGPSEAAGFRRFCTDAERIYRVLKAPFLEAQACSAAGLALRLKSASALRTIRPFTTLAQRLSEYFRDPRLIQLFARYATYVGTSPYAAPSTLMLIAHAEQDGVWTIDGGMKRLTDALCDVAAHCGVRISYNTEVARINIRSGRVHGVLLRNGGDVDADAVIFNGDAAALSSLAHEARLKPTPPHARTLSAITFALLADCEGFALAHHNVFFSRNYAEEFSCLMQQWQLPADPTVYVCAPAVSGAGPRPLFVLANAPADGETPMTEEETSACRTRVIQRLWRGGLSVRPLMEQITTPADFHRLFPATGGALYGRAPHGAFGTFSRPGARTRIAGLYLAGGSVHPGAGLPMAALSGQLAAQALCSDLASTR